MAGADFGHEEHLDAGVLAGAGRSTVGGPAAGASAAACPASPAGLSATAPGAAGPGQPVPPGRPSPASAWGAAAAAPQASWRSTSNPASFDAGDRASSAIHPVRRTNIRYSIRRATSPRSCQPRTTITAGKPAAQHLCPVLKPHSQLQTLAYCQHQIKIKDQPSGRLSLNRVKVGG